tara:strand:+ start:1692 stop:2906 length:1215 start_codon:yes stop_codon:yes gene_type:complete
MACKCTQTTINATGGGAITSALSACTYPIWATRISGCTTHNDIQVGKRSGNILFNIGQSSWSEDYTALVSNNNVGINKISPVHTFSMSGTIDVQDYMHFDSVGSGSKQYNFNKEVYLGFESGKNRINNQNSTYNVGVGAESLGSVGILNAGNNNTGVGGRTLQDVTQGDNNLAAGYLAGTNITTGGNNVLIGTQAGKDLTTHSGNVFIGYGQGYISTEENTLRIGNQIQDAAGTTRPLIQGNFATSAMTTNGYLGVNTTEPKTELSVVYNTVTSLANDTGGGDIVTFGATGADYAAGYLHILRAGAAGWMKADADALSEQGSLLGLALGAAPTNGILLRGFFKINLADRVTTWTIGGPLYVSDANGMITETAPAGAGDYIRKVGYMTSTENVIYFNPEFYFTTV